MRRYGLTLLIATALAVAACSSGGAKKVQATSPTVAGGNGATSTTAGAGAGGATAATAKSSSGGGGGAFCNDARNAGKSFNDPTSTANPLSDPAQQQKLLDQLKKIASSAPSEIRADMNTIVDWYSKFVTAMNDAKGDPQKLATALQSLQTDTTALTTASQHLDTYLSAHCGISSATSQP